MRYLQTVLIAMFIGMVLNQTKAQNLYIQLTDGSITTDELSDIRKLTITGDELTVHFWAGTADVYGLSAIRKLYFQENVAVTELSSATSSLGVFPNPAHSSITVRGLRDKPTEVLVFRSDGQLVISSTLSTSNASIDISSLVPGLYLLRTDGQTLKFIRQ